jgi:hypothetical protein
MDKEYKIEILERAIIILEDNPNLKDIGDLFTSDQVILELMELLEDLK